MDFNIQNVMAKVQEMQAKMKEVQAGLAAKTTTGESGGGMVRVTINGKLELQSVSIEKSIVNPDDVEMLEDLIASAVNKAIEKAQTMASEEMGALTGMLPNIPGLNLNM